MDCNGRKEGEDQQQQKVCVCVGGGGGGGKKKQKRRKRLVFNSFPLLQEFVILIEQPICTYICAYGSCGVFNCDFSEGTSVSVVLGEYRGFQRSAVSVWRLQNEM